MARLSAEEIADEIQQGLEDSPPLTADEAADLKVTNPHLYDLYRIRDRLRKQIMALEDQFNENPSGRAVYPLIQLYTKYLEVMAEIRALEEQNQYAGVIAQQVLEPMVSSIFQMFTDLLYLLNKVVVEEVGDNARVKQQFDKLALEFGRFLDGTKREATDKITEIYEGE